LEEGDERRGVGGLAGVFRGEKRERLYNGGFYKPLLIGPAVKSVRVRGQGSGGDRKDVLTCNKWWGGTGVYSAKETVSNENLEVQSSVNSNNHGSENFGGY